MHANFEAIFHSLMGSEGGFVNDPRDKGGATKWGVTQATLAAWRGKSVTVDDVKALGQDEAKLIFKQQYWAKVAGDDLPDGVDLCVTDMAFNSGPGRATKTLQQALLKCGQDVIVDGQIGLKTTAAAHAADMMELIDAFSAARLAFLKTTYGWSTFGKGWTNRVNRVQAEARNLAKRNPVALAAPLPVMEGSKDDHNVVLRKTSAGQAKIVAGVGAMGTAASDAAERLSSISDYLPTIKYLFLGLTVLGIAAGFYVQFSQLRDENVTTPAEQ